MDDMRLVADMLSCVAGLSKCHMGAVMYVGVTKVSSRLGCPCRIGGGHSVGELEVWKYVHLDVRMLLSVGELTSGQLRCCHAGRGLVAYCPAGTGLEVCYDEANCL